MNPKKKLIFVLEKALNADVPLELTYRAVRPLRRRARPARSRKSVKGGALGTSLRLAIASSY